MYYAPVQSDKTAESLQELLREATEYGSSHPPSDAELQRFKSSFVRSLPGKYETNRAVLGAFADMVEFKRPLDYIARNQSDIEALSVDDLVPVIAAQIKPTQTIWLVVGDLKSIEEPVRAANIAEVVVLDDNK